MVRTAHGNDRVAFKLWRYNRLSISGFFLRRDPNYKRDEGMITIVSATGGDL